MHCAYTVPHPQVLRWIGPPDHLLLDSLQRRPIDKTLEGALQKYDPHYGMPASLKGASPPHDA